LNVDRTVHTARVVRAVFESEQVTDLVGQHLTGTPQQFVGVVHGMRAVVARASEHSYAAANGRFTCT
jgi:hypothetical protein